MAITDAIMQVISARLIRRLRSNYVYAARCNKTFQGELMEGGKSFKVNILDPNSVTFGDYEEKEVDGTQTVITYPDMAVGDPVVVMVDQQKYWTFSIGDILAMQASPDLMDDAADEAAKKLSNSIDDQVRGVMWASASKKFADATHDFESQDTASTAVRSILNVFGAADRYLTLQNIPMEGRWCVFGPYTREMIGRSLEDAELNLGDAELNALYRNNFSGMLKGFSTFTSDRATDVSGSNPVEQIIFGNDYATIYVDQVSEVESIRLEGSFRTGVRGLYTWGTKMLESKGMLRAQWTYDNAPALADV